MAGKGKRGRKRTLNLPEYRYAAYSVFSNHDIKVGSVHKALYEKGGTPLMHWVSSQTPPDTEIAETLAAFALDAMHEMLDQKEK